MKKLSLIAAILAATGAFELAAANSHVGTANSAKAVYRNTIDTIPKKKPKRNPDPNPSPNPSPNPNPNPSPNPNPNPNPPSPPPPNPTPPSPTPPTPPR
jgi:hypothetical protein